MCINKTTPSMNTKRRPASRKSRNRVKKTKRLSEMQPTSTASAGGDTNSNQLKLLLNPENQVEERETHDQENVAYNFFSAADGGVTTLNGLLDASTNAASNSSHATTNISSSFRPDDLSPASVSLTYAYGGHDEESGAAFVRNAMRNRERNSSEEEKWVCYSEVVERKVKEEEVSSSAVDDRVGIQRLSLKLDYQEILNAWSDKGPLYIHAADSQVVPDVNDDYFSQVASNNGMSWGCNVGLWTVPEMIGDSNNNNGEMMMRNDELKMGQREASVLRYKEKRQNRLFSKKIRYQVRKLNAEKRPRLKGRFVKSS